MGNMARRLPPQDFLNLLLSYEPETGSLRWRERPSTMFKTDGQAKTWNSRFAGKEAMTALTSKGYRHGAINNTRYLAHRLVWKMFYGTEPAQIDHENGCKQDNSLKNLRSVDNLENHKNMPMQVNNTSGRVGVSWDRRRGKWVAYIKVMGKHKSLGRYLTFDSASAARERAEESYRFHNNHGRAAA